MQKSRSRAFLMESYQKLVESKMDLKLRVLRGASTTKCIVDEKEVLMLCSNNYLNLSNHPKLKEAAVQAIQTHGVGAGSARNIAANMDLHVELERRLANFKRAEASLTYTTGFAANAGLIPQLVGEGDLIIGDQLNHGSIIDGVRLARSAKAIYKHRDMDDLKRILESSRGHYNQVLIVSDGVFSMDGDIAPVDRIVELAQQFDAMTYVDDAHGEGVLGEQGRGIVSHFHVEGKVDVDMGTFSKAFGVFGGHISGSQDLVNFAYNRSRTWLLSTSPPPPVIAACIAALDVLEEEPQHVRNLWLNTRYFKSQLKDLGFDTGKSETPITPIMVGQSATARELGARLFEEGLFAFPIVYPLVAKNEARIRTIMNAALTREDIDFAIGVLERIGRRMKII